MDLDQIARWPGKSPLGALPAHPVAYHMMDAGAVAEVLLDKHPRSDLYRLLIALHDLGKIGAVFRNALLSGVTQDRKQWEVTEAWLLDAQIQAILAQRLGGSPLALPPLIAAIAGHHGRPPSANPMRDLPMMQKRAGLDAFRDAQAFMDACLDLWPKTSLDGLSQKEAKRLTWHLAGVTTVSDWIGSNTRWFSPVPATRTLAQHLDAARRIALTALREAGLLPPRPKGDALFSFALRPMQKAAQDIALPKAQCWPSSRTRPALARPRPRSSCSNECWARKKDRRLFRPADHGPADAMFRRFRHIVGRLFDGQPSLTLAHGRAGLSVEFQKVRNTAPGSGAPACRELLAESRRRALLADIGVKTVDQALMAVLPTRFATLRNWGVSHKALIVDEAHELGDPYMAYQLATLLHLHAMQGGSAILLTATLPLDLRARFSRAFCDGAGQSFAEDRDLRLSQLIDPRRRVGAPFLVILAPERRCRCGAAGQRGTGCRSAGHHATAGAACVWVRNAVDDAIAAVRALRTRSVPVDLLHARFALTDRKRIEADMIARFGRNETGRAGRVLVGTQVLESLLDLDFDMMVSNLAPVASLIQRAGRLWRHMDIRPAGIRPVPVPTLHVVSPDPSGLRMTAGCMACWMPGLGFIHRPINGAPLPFWLRRALSARPAICAP